MLERVAAWTVLVLASAGPAQAGSGTPVNTTAAAAASAASSKPIEAIDQFCDGLRQMTRETKRRRLLGLFSKDERDKGSWIEFAREGALNAAVKQEHVFDVAQVWTREDGATAVSMRLTSGSGDWFHFIEYCFRPDGTLARVNSTLNTFNAVDPDSEKDAQGATRERDRYFDSRGKQIKVSRRVLDLETKKPAPRLQIMDDEEPIYRAATALPFFPLLAPPRRPVQSGATSGAASSRR